MFKEGITQGLEVAQTKLVQVRDGIVSTWNPEFDEQKRMEFKAAGGAVALYLLPNIQATPLQETLEWRAEVTAEPGYFYSRGSGLENLMTRFAHAHMAAHPDDDGNIVGVAAGRFIDLLNSRPLGAAEGVCNGFSSIQVLKSGLFPSGGRLGRFAFSKDDIAGLAAILEVGDAHVRESKDNGSFFNTGERNTAAFLDHMVYQYLDNRTGFVIDISPNHETWTNPVDYAYMVRNRLSGGQTQVDLRLGAAGYLDAGHQTAGNRREFRFVYQVSDDPADLGRFISRSVPFKGAYYPDPTRWIGGYQIRGNIFTRSMIYSLNDLAGGIIPLDCTLTERDC